VLVGEVDDPEVVRDAAAADQHDAAVAQRRQRVADPHQRRRVARHRQRHLHDRRARVRIRPRERHPRAVVQPATGVRRDLEPGRAQALDDLPGQVRRARRRVAKPVHRLGEPPEVVDGRRRGRRAHA
jgi:hypothetical protein